jgi:murein DD-endopeptidase MepM/ murein hydrolase activator NlpD
MKQSRPSRRIVVMTTSRREVALIALSALAVVAAICIIGLSVKGPPRREVERFGVGPEYVPSIVPVSLEKGWVSSEFGMRVHPITGERKMHLGIDLAVDEGVPVKATAKGKVIFAGNASGYGNLVKIDHGNGIETRYAHNSAVKVKEGDLVQRGQAIALAGHSGVATGDHLHYEVRVNGQPVDPRNYLPELVEGGRPGKRGAAGKEQTRDRR